MTTPDADARAAAPTGHDAVAMGPGLDTRRRWISFGVAVAVFLAIVFALARWGAEPGNEARFGFPDKVEGLVLTKPDRAPEARNREITTHYDQSGDGVATLVVEWLPDTTIEDVLGRSAGDDGIACLGGAEVSCATALEDGVVRVSQESSDERSVQDLLRKFLADRIVPDRVS